MEAPAWAKLAVKRLYQEHGFFLSFCSDMFSEAFLIILAWLFQFQMSHGMTMSRCRQTSTHVLCPILRMKQNPLDPPSRPLLIVPLAELCSLPFSKLATYQRVKSSKTRLNLILIHSLGPRRDTLSPEIENYPIPDGNWEVFLLKWKLGH